MARSADAAPGRYRHPGRTGLYEIEGSRTSGSRPAKRPSALRRTLTWSGRSKAAGSPSSAATAGGTASCPSEINYRANVYGFKMLGVADGSSR